MTTEPLSHEVEAFTSLQRADEHLRAVTVSLDQALNALRVLAPWQFPHKAQQVSTDSLRARPSK